MAHLLVEVVGREIDPGPARHQGQRALMIDLAAVVGIFGGGLRFGAPEDHAHHAEHQYLGRVAAGLGSELANCSYARRDHLGGRPRHKNAFGMPGRELPAARRGAGLVEHWSALRRRFAQVDGVEPVILALMSDAVHL